MKHIKEATLGRRTAALLFDLVAIFLLAEGSFAFITTPILGNHFNAGEMTQAITSYQLESNLFVLNEETNSLNARPAEEYPQAIYEYYVESGLAGKTYTLETYYDEILLRNAPETVFDWTTLPGAATPWNVAVIEGEEAEATTFYKDAYQSAINEFEATEAFSNLATPLADLQARGHIITYVIFILIWYLILPSFLKHGATLGKLIMQVGHVTMYGYKMSKAQKPYRAVTAFLINWVGLIFALPIVSIVVLTVRKDGRSLTDLGAGTMTIDTKNSIIFNNIEEQDDFDSRMAKQKEDIEEWREEIINKKNNDN